jgi:hypothetical protein
MYGENHFNEEGGEDLTVNYVSSKKIPKKCTVKIISTREEKT